MTQNYYIFYFETADDNEFEILRNFLEGQQLACNLAAESTAQQQREEAFGISRLPRAAGSAVAELLISARFGKKLRELHSYEAENAPVRALRGCDLTLRAGEEVQAEDALADGAGHAAPLRDARAAGGVPDADEPIHGWAGC